MESNKIEYDKRLKATKKAAVGFAIDKYKKSLNDLLKLFQIEAIKML